MTTIEKTKSYRKTARIVGVLFLTSNFVFILGAVVLIEPMLNAPDYLNQISANRSQLILGTLLELVNSIAYLGIAVLLFPILKQRFESIALGYVGFRIIEFIMQVLSDLSPLSLVTLSEDFLSAGTLEVASYQTLGTMLIAERFWAFQMVSITFGLGALLFYYGSAAYGYCSSRKFHYFGYKLVMITTMSGIPIVYDLVPANMDER